MARILVIEDNQDNLALMNYLLKAFGHHVESARDGLAGFLLAYRGEADLIVCDVHLPKLDGYEIARRLNLHPGCRPPLIAVTALAMVGDRDRLLAAGFDGYIAKPIEPTTFVGQIEAFLPHAGGGSTTPTPFDDSAPIPFVALAPNAARVLVVDDSPVNHQLTRALLEPFGYRLRFATDARSALAWLARADFDLIISDLHMPDDDGLALLAKVKAQSRRPIPFMLVSSSSHDDVDARRACELGASCFLFRPIEPERLLEAVEHCLDHGKDRHGRDIDAR